MDEPKMHKKFYEGLFNKYNMRSDDLKKFKYSGGDRGVHEKYSKMLKMNIENIPREYYCVCGHPIKENCYVSDGEKILVLGNCCIKKFIPKENQNRTCSLCGSSHKNRNVNLCNNCKNRCKNCNGKNSEGTDIDCPNCYKNYDFCGVCNQKHYFNSVKSNRCKNCNAQKCYKCHKQIIKKNWEKCLKSFIKDEKNRVYFKVPFSEKEEAKSLGCNWDPDKKLWYCINLDFDRYRITECKEKWSCLELKLFDIDSFLKME
jgi:hypothetical protein